MKFHILEAGYLQEKFIKADEVPHQRDELLLLGNIVVFNQVFCLFEIEGQLLLVS